MSYLTAVRYITNYKNYDTFLCRPLTQCTVISLSAVFDILKKGNNVTQKVGVDFCTFFGSEYTFKYIYIHMSVHLIIILEIRQTKGN